MSTTETSLITRLIDAGYSFFKIIRRDQRFIFFITILVFIAGAAYPYPRIAMWVGFMLAGYAVVANDSIQTIGTFLASNHQRPWWVLWLFIGGLFLATVTYSWFAYSGDVSHARLSAKGFSEAPTSFSFLQIAAPIFLLVLTRLRMPVSTTFLMLSCFALDRSGIDAVLLKSVSGYGVAFIVAILVWMLATRLMDRAFKGEASPIWVPLQWVSTGFLWVNWVIQDAANVAVFLPRQLSAVEFIAFAGFIFLGLGALFFMRGDRIQQIVEEKTDVLDIRWATVIDFIYALILFGFKQYSTIPMSTTWVFIGLLAGREFGMGIARAGKAGWSRKSFGLMGKDLRNAIIGLIVSIIIALAANPALWE